VAIDDIVARIASDAEAEGAALLDAARADADRIVAGARERAQEGASHTLARARADAGREAETMLSAARLAARDETLAARRALDLEALARVEDALAALPDVAYAALLAREIAKAAAPGDVARLGGADAERLRATLPAALSAAGVTVTVDAVSADVERGVVLVGDRMRVEISPAALVAARRDELESVADSGLFGPEE